MQNTFGGHGVAGFGVAVKCVARVEAGGGRTVDQPCGPTKICGVMDVLAWRRTASSWIEGAAGAARTPDEAVKVATLRSRFANVVAVLPRGMVNEYVWIAARASCLMEEFVSAEIKRRTPAPTPTPPPQPPPQPGGGWTVPGLPGLPDLPRWQWPQFPEGEQLLLIALLLFAGGWLTGELWEDF